LKDCGEAAALSARGQQEAEQEPKYPEICPANQTRWIHRRNAYGLIQKLLEGGARLDARGEKSGKGAARTSKVAPVMWSALATDGPAAEAASMRT
jgi:hypothetical protein